MMCVIPSKKSLDRLGISLLHLGQNEQADEAIYTQLNSYRSLFHPLMTNVNIQCRSRIARTLTKSKIKDTIVVQRIKRLESITLKLQRFPKMQLSNMQDIGGVRVILPDMDSIRKFCKDLFNRSKTILVKDNRKDYVEHPKEDGYRGIHYILEVANKRTDIAPFEKLVVELQVRTMLQHCWATGVEIAGIINNKHYKVGDWETDWKTFFVLLSECFAKLEKGETRKKSDYSMIDPEGLKELRMLAEELNVIDQLKSASKTFKTLEDHFREFPIPKEGFLLLVTDFELQRTSVASLTSDETKALADLTVWEKRFRLKSSGKMTGQALLIKTKDVKNLKKAYPNYYMDTQMLIDELQKLIQTV